MTKVLRASLCRSLAESSTCSEKLDTLEDILTQSQISRLVREENVVTVTLRMLPELCQNSAF